MEDVKQIIPFRIKKKSYWVWQHS